METEVKKRNFFSSVRPKQSDRTRELHAKFAALIESKLYGKDIPRLIDYYYDRLQHEVKHGRR